MPISRSLSTRRSHPYRAPKRTKAISSFSPFPSYLLPAWLPNALAKLQVRQVSAVLYECSPDWHLRERKIADDMFFYVVEGKGYSFFGRKKLKLGHGSCVHFQHGIPHEVGHDPRQPLRVVCIHYTAFVFNSLRLSELIGFPPCFDFSNDDVAERLTHEACREFALQPPGYALGLEALVVRLLFHLLREPRHARRFKFPVGGERFQDLSRLFPVLQWINSHVADPGALSSIARRAGLSEVQFRRVFQRAMGMNPVRYLREVRLKKACELLMSSDLTVEAISSEVGYTEPSFFARMFKEVMGISPGAYRHRIEW
jgi:AraC-like DNA-binding protein/mannose-6-phosphate isomerase-like protein (cupin superfamily)